MTAHVLRAVNILTGIQRSMPAAVALIQRQERIICVTSHIVRPSSANGHCSYNRRVPIRKLFIERSAHTQK
jgi:hypothetical protein